MSTAVRALRIPFLALALTLLAGCAASGGKSVATVPPEERAQQRWDALLAGDFIKAYGFLSPGMRSESTAEAYAAQMSVRPVKWQAAEVAGAECEADDAGGLCRVTVRVTFTAPANTPGVKQLGSTTSLIERWIQVDGQWYFVSRHVALGR